MDPNNPNNNPSNPNPPSDNWLTPSAPADLTSPAAPVAPTPPPAGPLRPLSEAAPPSPEPVPTFVPPAPVPDGPAPAPSGMAPVPPVLPQQPPSAPASTWGSPVQPDMPLAPVMAETAEVPLAGVADLTQPTTGFSAPVTAPNPFSAAAGAAPAAPAAPADLTANQMGVSEAPDWSVTAPPKPDMGPVMDASPTDLSQLAETTPAPAELPTATPESMPVDSTVTSPLTDSAQTATPPGKKSLPLWIMLVGGLVLLLAVGAASAYFILGIGQSAPPTEEAQPATEQTAAPLPAATVQPVAATPSGSFGELSGSSPSAQSPAPSTSSAIERIRQRQQSQ